jgi:hypothetical protein
VSTIVRSVTNINTIRVFASELTGIGSRLPRFVRHVPEASGVTVLDGGEHWDITVPLTDEEHALLLQLLESIERRVGVARHDSPEKT